MSRKSIQISISKMVKTNASYFKKAAPTTLAIALASAAFLPALTSSTPESAVGLSVLSGLGTEFLKDIIKNVLAKLGKKKDEEILQELEDDFLKKWNAPGKTGVAFRQELSQFLQRNGIIQMAMEAAPQDARDGMAQSLAELANQFNEFGWVLDEIRETMADIQKRQVEQLATQHEQLELQREQLAKTNLLLKLQREHKKKSAPVIPQNQTEDPPPADIPCPYKGLASFQPEDAEYFFGREELTAQLLARLAGTTFLGVIGPSGSGKSSLVRAGLVPALWNGEIPGSADWKVLILRPGSSPLEEIAVRVALQSGISTASLLTDLRRDADALRLAIQQYLVGQSEDAKFVLVIDQFEELFTQCENEDERAQFIAALVTAAQSTAGRMIVILTLRADFYGHCAAYPDLAALLSANQVLIGAMSMDELRRAVSMPAERVGLALEPGLVEMVLQDAQGEAGALPMVSHVMMETWKNRRGHWLKVDAYRAFGGMHQAIAITADTVYSAFSDIERERVREIFLRLTHLDENGAADEYHDTRRRIPLSDLIPANEDQQDTEHLLDILTNARLVVKDTGRGNSPEIEIAHEALIRHWDRLRNWLNEDRDALRLRQGISEAARDWHNSGSDESLLNHRGARLELALSIRVNPRHGLNSIEQAYLDNCKALRERERQSSTRRRLYIAAGIFTAIILIMAILAGWGWTSSENSQLLVHQIATANSAKATAVSEGNFRATAQVIAETQTDIAVSRQLGLQSILMKELQPDLAMLLSVAALKTKNTVEAKVSLLDNLSYRPTLSAYLNNKNANVSTIVFSPDGKTLASGLVDGTILLWDIETLQPLSPPLIGHTTYVNALEYSPDGQTVVSSACNQSNSWEGCTESEIIFWDIVNSKQKGSSIIDKKLVRDLIFHPDGNKVAAIVDTFPTGSFLFIWDMETIQVIHEIPFVSSEYGMPGIPLSKDWKWLFSGNQIWNIQNFQPSGTPIELPPNLSYPAIAIFNATGEIFILKNEQKITFWDFKAQQILGEQFLSGEDRVDDTRIMAISTDGKILATGDRRGNIKLWNTTTHEPIGESLQVNQGISDIAFSPDNTILASSSYGRNEIILWDLNRRYHPMATPISENKSIRNNIAISPDGKTMVTDDLRESKIYLRSTDNPNQISAIEIQNTWKTIVDMTISTDNQSLAVLGCKAIDPEIGCTVSEITIWNLSTLEKITDIPTSELNVNNLLFSPTGNILIANGCDTLSSDLAQCVPGKILVWDAQTYNSKREPVVGHENNIVSMVFDAQNNRLVTGNNDGSIVFWDIETFIPLEKIVVGKNSISSLAFNEKGNVLAAGINADKKIFLWDTVIRRKRFRIVVNFGHAKTRKLPPGRQRIRNPRASYSPR
jgi:WD40 repeat protein/energy-coupling factor transporter ATP-binding protein EcfA2